MLRMSADKPGRVLITTDAVGGVWRYALDLARGLQSRGVETVLAGFGPPPDSTQCREAEPLADLRWTDCPLDWMVTDPAPLRAVPDVLAALADDCGAQVIHANAHFLRGVMRELQARGHRTLALEPEDGWSRSNLRRDQGPGAEEAFFGTFPELTSRSYGAEFDHAAALPDADVVVHEWTPPALVQELGRLRRRANFTLLFHDTHHRAVSAEADIADLMLQDYDGILAFGETLRERYLARGWGRQVFTWHEGVDDRLFRPMPQIARSRDLIWIGNWGDGERSEELAEFLIGPAERLGLSATVRGVRYPQQAREDLAAAGLAYEGWIANVDVPAAFARHRVTVHVPRRPYVEALPGIPTIRPFEALGCGIPLVSAP